MLNIDKPTWTKLRRLITLNERSRRLGDETPESVYAEMRKLNESMTAEFLPLVESLVKAGLITISITDNHGRFQPRYREVNYMPTSTGDNGNIWISACDDNYAGGSLKRHPPGTEPLLQTWNPADGHEGCPVRPILLFTSHLMAKAFLAGGPGWDDDSKPGDFLVVHLEASNEPQTAEEYDFYFENYRPWSALRYHRDDVTSECVRLDGGTSASWAYDITVGGLPTHTHHDGRCAKDMHIDQIIHMVCRHHDKEIRRLYRAFNRQQEKE